MIVVRSQELEYVPASHEDPTNPGVLKKVLATKKQLCEGRVQMLNWSCLRAGRSFERHYHEDMQEVFVIVSGRGEMTVEVADAAESGEPSSIMLEEGDAILIEAGEIHSMANPDEQDMLYIVFGISEETNGKTVVV